MVWAVFGQTLRYEFINFDDDVYVYGNPAVTQGLSLHGVVWTFTHDNGPSEWLPLTAISRMLDWQLYGPNAGGHHLSNVLLHAATAILLFLVLRKMTGALGRSAFVAAVFAIHPLGVESVAWVTERKNVLSGLFFMLTLWAYVRYAQGVVSDPPSLRFSAASKWQVTRAEEQSLSRVTYHRSLFYWLAVLFFTLGLLSKGTLVTLPFILLLLDYWPLGRVTRDKWRVTSFRIPVPQLLGAAKRPATSKCNEDGSEDGSSLKRLLLEKLPFLLLAAADCVVVFLTHQSDRRTLQSLGVLSRVGNALAAFGAYLGQMFYPVGLAVYYPHPGNHLSVWQVGVSVLVLLIISVGVMAGWRKYPYLPVGWLWYLGMLVPVIGLVQVGAQARADRHTYLPQIGLYLLVVWGVVELCGSWRWRRVVLGSAAVVILAGLLATAYVQTRYWNDSVSLWTHTLACTSDNVLGQNDLGNALLQKGEVDGAIAHYQKAMQINPDNAEAHNNLSFALLQKGKVDEAIAQCRRALQINPDLAEAHNNLGDALLLKGNVDEAIAHFQKALQIKPDSAQAQGNLGSALLQKGDVDGAIAHYQKALQISPDSAAIRNNLQSALLQKGRVSEVIAYCQKALQINPDSPVVLNNLAWLLATCPDTSIRNGAQAVKYAERACALTHYRETLMVGTLAAAYAEAGRFDDAIATAEKAIALAEKNHEPELLQKNRELLELYRAHKPYHEISARQVQPSPGSGATGARPAN
jgi:tetratricopeptide (TPR) repeat protein